MSRFTRRSDQQREAVGRCTGGVIGVLATLLIGLCACDGPTAPDAGEGTFRIGFAFLTDSSAGVMARWRAPEPGLVFPWSSRSLPGGALWNLSGVADIDSVEFTVPRAADSTAGEFCVQSRRVQDDATSPPVCGQFTVPGNSAPLPPDSLEIEVGWRVIAPRWNGDSTVVGVYLAHVPTVESWTLSVDDAGAWRGVQTVPNVLYPLGTPQGVASQQFPCETHYTYTGDPQRPANGGPWADGSDWQCAFDVDPYFATSWVFPRRPVTYAVRTRLDGYDAEGKLVAAWAGEWEIRARS